MGRYDNRWRFRNTANNGWVSPSQIRIRNAANTAWIDYGVNSTSYNTKEIRVRNQANTAWIRVTRNRQDITHYGDKHAYQTSGGYMRLGNDSVFNLNRNIFVFQATVKKDVNNDKWIATFKDSTNTAGWSILWMADGRIRWETRYGSTSYYSYSSNAVASTNTYVFIQIHFASTGTGTGLITWNGVNSTANRTGRHQMSANVLNLGGWGTSFKGALRCQGINYSGTTVNRTGDVQNLAVSSSNQTSGSLSTVNTTVSQDTWTTTNWI